MGMVTRVMKKEWPTGDGTFEIKENLGYNAKTGLLEEDMFKAGIIDPAKVTRTAIRNAVSAAAMLLTTEAAIAEEPKDEKDSPMQGGMGEDY